MNCILIQIGWIILLMLVRELNTIDVSAIPDSKMTDSNLTKWASFIIIPSLPTTPWLDDATNIKTTHNNTTQEVSIHTSNIFFTAGIEQLQKYWSSSNTLWKFLTIISDN